MNIIKQIEINIGIQSIQIKNYLEMLKKGSTYVTITKSLRLCKQVKKSRQSVPLVLDSSTLSHDCRYNHFSWNVFLA